MVLVLLGAVAMLATAGCVVRAGVHAGGTVVAEPDLVEVSPGVWVVEDYDEPVFYSEGSYWLYRDGIWFRSHVHTGSWVRVRSTPVVVARISTPRAYVRYRGNVGARYRTGPRGSVRVRDNSYRPRGHAVRDQRHERNDHRREVRDDRRDHRQDARDDRREHRQDVRDDRREHKQEAREDRHEEKQERREEKQERREDKRDDRQDKREDKREDKGNSGGRRRR